jgi:ABC-type ATPase with predicted acetyltransferase domain
MQIKKWCKWARGVNAKRRETNGPKTRAGRAVKIYTIQAVVCTTNRDFIHLAAREQALGKGC